MEFKRFYKEFKNDKIKINWNKNPIEMKLFLSFLTVETKRSESYLGQHNGWTKLENEELKLYVSGGSVGGVEYLDSLKYGTNLGNVWNDFVNPFYLFDIMNKEGRNFFLNYYKDDIQLVLDNKNNNVSNLNKKLKEAREEKKWFKKCIETLNIQP